MTFFRRLLEDMGSIHMSQNSRDQKAANKAHLRNATRRARSFNKVNQTIARKAANHRLS